MLSSQDQITYAASALGAAAAGLAGGPLAEVFNEMALVMALMGAIGGGARYVALRRNPRRAAGLSTAIVDGLGTILLGATLAFGLGALVPAMLRTWFGLEIPPDSPTTSLLASAAFVIGLLQERALARLGLSEQEDEDDE